MGNYISNRIWRDYDLNLWKLTKIDVSLFGIRKFGVILADALPAKRVLIWIIFTLTEFIVFKGVIFGAISTTIALFLNKTCPTLSVILILDIFLQSEVGGETKTGFWQINVSFDSHSFNLFV